MGRKYSKKFPGIVDMKIEGIKECEKISCIGYQWEKLERDVFSGLVMYSEKDETLIQSSVLKQKRLLSQQ